MPAKLLTDELKHLIGRITPKEWIGFAVAAVVFGYVVPARYGLDFLDVYFLLAYACLPSLFVSPMVADSVLGWRPAVETSRVKPGNLYGAQVLAAALFAWAWGIAVLALGITIANQVSRMGELILPPTVILANVVALSAALTLLSAAAVGWLALNSKTAAEAKGNTRRIFLLLLLGIVLWVRMGPAETKRSVDAGLMSGQISIYLLPVSLICILLGAAAIRAGVTRKTEEAEGPLFKI